MKKINYSKLLLIGVIILIGGFSAQGQETIIYSTGFESADGFTANASYNNTAEIFSGASGKQWGTFYGSPSTTSPIVDLQSMQMRWYTSATSNLGYTYTNFDLANVTKVTFKAANTAGINVIVSYSTDGGVNYVGSQTFTLSTASTAYSYPISSTGAFPLVRIKFQITYATAPTATSRLYLDDVSVYGISVTTASPKTLQNPGIYSSNGNVLLTASAGEIIEVFSVAGQRLEHTTAVEGLNTIPVSCKGIVIVKVADRFAKVLL